MRVILVPCLLMLSSVILGAQAPADGAEGVATTARQTWITGTLERIRETDGAARDEAIHALLGEDDDGDTVRRLTDLLRERRHDASLRVAIVRGLGRDGLAAAIPHLLSALRHPDPIVRGNAAVSLEYVGLGDKGVRTALLRMARREKDVHLANHAWRALGRCGRGDPRVRDRLVEAARKARSPLHTIGPSIGLAYFADDPVAARGLEQVLKRLGVPKAPPRSRRTGFSRTDAANDARRAITSWSLCQVGDSRQARQIRKRLFDRLARVRSDWARPHQSFWDDVARVLEGETDRMEAVVEGVRERLVSYAGIGEQGLREAIADECRTGRRGGPFRPLGDELAPQRKPEGSTTGR